MPHPLAPVVLALFAHETTLDVTMVSDALAGGGVSPAKGQRAYRIVAADVLGYLWCSGALVRHGHCDAPRCPERGGWYYTLASQDETPQPAAAETRPTLEAYRYTTVRNEV